MKAAIIILVVIAVFLWLARAVFKEFGVMLESENDD
jgi:hypothetical protein